MEPSSAVVDGPNGCGKSSSQSYWRINRTRLWNCDRSKRAVGYWSKPGEQFDFDDIQRSDVKMETLNRLKKMFATVAKGTYSRVQRRKQSSAEWERVDGDNAEENQ